MSRRPVPPPRPNPLPRSFRLFSWFFVLCLLLSLSSIGLVTWVIIHFVSKYW